jgi:hydroxymethylglutaryl-CoA lyase
MNRTPERGGAGICRLCRFRREKRHRAFRAVSTAFGCSMEGRVPFSQVLSVVECFREIGVRELSLSDTTGMANPSQVYDYCLQARRQFPDVTWVLHFHNTRGMGLANVVTGMLAGVTRFDACFAGLGGCPFAPGASGNIATEDVVHMCQEMGIETGYDLEKVLAIGRRIQDIVGRRTDSAILRAGRCCDLKQ